MGSTFEKLTKKYRELSLLWNDLDGESDGKLWSDEYFGPKVKDVVKMCIEMKNIISTIPEIRLPYLDSMENIKAIKEFRKNLEKIETDHIPKVSYEVIKKNYSLAKELEEFEKNYGIEMPARAKIFDILDEIEKGTKRYERIVVVAKNVREKSRNKGKRKILSH